MDIPLIRIPPAQLFWAGFFAPSSKGARGQFDGVALSRQVETVL